MSLEDELATILVQEVQKEIDESIILDFLVDGGWTEITHKFYKTDQLLEVTDWCEKTLTKNQWRYLAGSFVIRDKKEVEWFILRWL